MSQGNPRTGTFTVAIHDVSGVWSTIKPVLEGRAGVEKLDLRRSVGAKSTQVDIVRLRYESQDSPRLTRLSKTEHPLAWFRQPFVTLLLVSCSDTDEYRRSLRAQLLSATAAAAGQPPSAGDGAGSGPGSAAGPAAAAPAPATVQRGQVETPWVVAFLRPAAVDVGGKGPRRAYEKIRDEMVARRGGRAVFLEIGTAAAPTPVRGQSLSATLSFAGARLSGDSTPGSRLGWAGRGSGSGHPGAAARGSSASGDGGSGSGSADGSEVQAGNAGFDELESLLFGCIKSAFEQRCARYDEEIARLRRLEPAPDFGSFFLVQDSLALLLEGAGLHGEALRELEALEAHYHALYKQQPSAAALGLGTNLNGAEVAALLGQSATAMRQQVMASGGVYHLQFLQHLYARQAALFLKMATPRHIARAAARGCVVVQHLSHLLSQNEHAGQQQRAFSKAAWTVSACMSLLAAFAPCCNSPAKASDEPLPPTPQPASAAVTPNGLPLPKAATASTPAGTPEELHPPPVEAPAAPATASPRRPSISENGSVADSAEPLEKGGHGGEMSPSPMPQAASTPAGESLGHLVGEAPATVVSLPRLAELDLDAFVDVALQSGVHSSDEPDPLRGKNLLQALTMHLSRMAAPGSFLHAAVDAEAVGAAAEDAAAAAADALLAAVATAGAPAAPAAAARDGDAASRRRLLGCLGQLLLTVRSELLLLAEAAEADPERLPLLYLKGSLSLQGGVPQRKPGEPDSPAVTPHSAAATGGGSGTADGKLAQLDLRKVAVPATDTPSAGAMTPGRPRLMWGRLRSTEAALSRHRRARTAFEEPAKLQGPLVLDLGKGLSGSSPAVHRVRRSLFVRLNNPTATTGAFLQEYGSHSPSLAGGGSTPDMKLQPMASSPDLPELPGDSHASTPAPEDSQASTASDLSPASNTPEPSVTAHADSEGAASQPLTSTPPPELQLPDSSSSDSATDPVSAADVERALATPACSGRGTPTPQLPSAASAGPDSNSASSPRASADAPPADGAPGEGAALQQLLQEPAALESALAMLTWACAWVSSALSRRRTLALHCAEIGSFYLRRGRWPAALRLLTLADWQLHGACCWPQLRLSLMTPAWASQLLVCGMESGSPADVMSASLRALAHPDAVFSREQKRQLLQHVLAWAREQPDDVLDRLPALDTGPLLQVQPSQGRFSWYWGGGHGRGGGRPHPNCYPSKPGPLSTPAAARKAAQGGVQAAAGDIVLLDVEVVSQLPQHLLLHDVVLTLSPLPDPPAPAPQQPKPAAAGQLQAARPPPATASLPSLRQAVAASLHGAYGQAVAASGNGGRGSGEAALDTARGADDDPPAFASPFDAPDRASGGLPELPAALVQGQRLTDASTLPAGLDAERALGKVLLRPGLNTFRFSLCTSQVGLFCLRSLHLETDGLHLRTLAPILTPALPGNVALDAEQLLPPTAALRQPPSLGSALPSGDVAGCQVVLQSVEAAQRLAVRAAAVGGGLAEGQLGWLGVVMQPSDQGTAPVLGVRLHVSTASPSGGASNRHRTAALPGAAPSLSQTLSDAMATATPSASGPAASSGFAAPAHSAGASCSVSLVLPQRAYSCLAGAGDAGGAAAGAETARGLRVTVPLPSEDGCWQEMRSRTLDLSRCGGSGPGGGHPVAWLAVKAGRVRKQAELVAVEAVAAASAAVASALHRPPPEEPEVAALAAVEAHVEYWAAGCWRSHVCVLSVPVVRPFSVEAHAFALLDGRIALQLLITSQLQQPCTVTCCELALQPGLVLDEAAGGGGSGGLKTPVQVGPGATASLAYLLTLPPSPETSAPTMMTELLHGSCSCLDIRYHMAVPDGLASRILLRRPSALLAAASTAPLDRPPVSLLSPTGERVTEPGLQVPAPPCSPQPLRRSGALRGAVTPTPTPTAAAAAAATASSTGFSGEPLPSGGGSPSSAAAEEEAESAMQYHFVLDLASLLPLGGTLWELEAATPHVEMLPPPRQLRLGQPCVLSWMIARPVGGGAAAAAAAALLGAPAVPSEPEEEGGGQPESPGRSMTGCSARKDAGGEAVCYEIASGGAWEPAHGVRGWVRLGWQPGLHAVVEAVFTPLLTGQLPAPQLTISSPISVAAAAGDTAQQSDRTLWVEPPSPAPP